MDDHEKIRKSFKDVLLLEINSRYANEGSLDSAAPDTDFEPAAPRNTRPGLSERSNIDRSADDAAFAADASPVAPGEGPVDQTTEGHSINVPEAQQELVQSLAQQVGRIDAMIADLNNPNSDTSLNRHLAKLSKAVPADEKSALSDLSKKSAPLIEKAATAISALQVKLNSVLSQSDSLGGEAQPEPELGSTESALPAPAPAV